MAVARGRASSAPWKSQPLLPEDVDIDRAATKRDREAEMLMVRRNLAVATAPSQVISLKERKKMHQTTAPAAGKDPKQLSSLTSKGVDKPLCISNFDFELGGVGGCLSERRVVLFANRLDVYKVTHDSRAPFAVDRTIWLSAIEDVDILNIGFTLKLLDGDHFIFWGPKSGVLDDWIIALGHLIDTEELEDKGTLQGQASGQRQTPSPPASPASARRSTRLVSSSSRGSSGSAGSSGRGAGTAQQARGDGTSTIGKSHTGGHGYPSVPFAADDGRPMHASTCPPSVKASSGTMKTSDSLPVSTTVTTSTGKSLELPATASLSASTIRSLEEWLQSLKEEVVCMGFLGFQHGGGMLIRFAVLFRDRLDSWSRVPCYGHPHAADGRLELRHLSRVEAFGTGLIVVHKSRRLGIHAGSDEEAKAWASALEGCAAPLRQPAAPPTSTPRLSPRHSPRTPGGAARAPQGVPDGSGELPSSAAKGGRKPASPPQTPPSQYRQRQTRLAFTSTSNPAPNLPHSPW